MGCIRSLLRVGKRGVLAAGDQIVAGGGILLIGFLGHDRDELRQICFLRQPGQITGMLMMTPSMFLGMGIL